MQQEGFEMIYPNVWRHIYVNTSKRDYMVIEAIAIEKADQGHMVEILPEIVEKEVELGNELLPNAIGAKNPDLRINGEYVEVKMLESASENSIDRNIKNAHKQAHHVILNLPVRSHERDLCRIAKGKLKVMKSVDVVEFRYNGQYYSYNKSLFGY